MLFHQLNRKNGYGEDNAREEQPDSKQGEQYIKGLTDDIKPEDLATMHLLDDGLEVSVKTDAGESQDKGPVLILVEDLVDGTHLVGTKDRTDDEGCHQRSHKEANDKFGETNPNLAGTHGAFLGVVDTGGKEDCHKEGRIKIE
jgi:hypothetical protein